MTIISDISILKFIFIFNAFIVLFYQNIVNKRFDIGECHCTHPQCHRNYHNKIFRLKILANINIYTNYKINKIQLIMALNMFFPRNTFLFIISET